MLTVPSVLGIISANPNSKRLTKRHRLVRPNRTRGRQRLTRIVSTTIYKRRAAKFLSISAARPEPQECCIHRHCDKLYQQFSPAQRATWKAAVKAPKMSAYDLWMSECLTCCLMHEPAPDAPSISGGWSTKKVKPGTGQAPDWCWAPPPIHSPAATFSCYPCPVNPNGYTIIAATWEPWAWELPPDLQVIQTRFWWTFYGAWYTAGYHPFSDFPVRLHTQPAHQFPYLCASWPRDEPHDVTSPLVRDSTWSSSDPNNCPWDPPPLPPDPWPNPPA